MGSGPCRRKAYDYAERVCGRFATVLLQQRQARGLSRYALEQTSGVSRVMIGRIETGASIPTFYVGAQLARALEIPLAQLVCLAEEPDR